MRSLKKIIVIFITIFLSFYIYSQQNNTDDIIEEDDTSWLRSYISLDPSDDLYYNCKLKNYKISRDYVKNLIYNQDIDFFIEPVDDYNLRKNINILPRFPYVLLPYGGYSYNRGLDVGYLFRADNIANTRLALTAAFSFAQNNNLWLHTNVEYPALLNDRFKLFSSLSFFTSYPQYAARLGMFPAVGTGFIMSTANRAWRLLKIQFNKYNETGFYFTSGVDYRIPFIELNWISLFEINYKYITAKEATIVGNPPINEYNKNERGKILHDSFPKQELINENNFGFNFQTELRWNKFKQTPTIPVGNCLSALIKFYIPTSIGYYNTQFRFKTRIEEKFNYKIYREIAMKFRLIAAIDYNMSEDFSGDPYIRGFADYELTGWVALLANIEGYIPLIDFSLIRGPDTRKPFNNPAKFVLYWIFFADGGFTIDNSNYCLENFNERREITKINNYSAYLTKDNSIYITPAISLGSGLHFYPYFLHFMLRVDVSCNILKVVFYQKPLECFGVDISFNQMF